MRDEKKLLEQIEDILRNINSIHEYNKNNLPSIHHQLYYVPIYISRGHGVINKTNIALIPECGNEAFDRIYKIDDAIFEGFLTAKTPEEAYTKALEMVVAEFKEQAKTECAYITALHKIEFVSENDMIHFLGEECKERRKIIQSESDGIIPEIGDV